MKKMTLIIVSVISLSGMAQSSLKSIDGIVNQLMEEVTINKGEKMDTAAIRNLFHPTAQLSMLSGPDSASLESVSLNDFLEMLMDPYYEEGYLEQELHKVVEEFNGIAIVFQTFYGQDSEGNKEKGMNSYQLVYYQNRWWILSLLWTMESEENRLPEKYLPE